MAEGTPSAGRLPGALDREERTASDIWNRSVSAHCGQGAYGERVRS